MRSSRSRPHRGRAAGGYPSRESPARTVPATPATVVPALIINILLGVVTLAVLVLAFLASKVWHWAHVLTLVAFYFASVGFALLASHTLSLRLDAQKKYVQVEKQLEDAVELNDAIAYGASDSSVANRLASQGVELPETADGVRGIVQARHQVNMLNRSRGRVWRFAQPVGIDPQTRMIQVNFPFQRPRPAEDEAPLEGEAPAAEGPAPALGMEVGSIVYAFEQGPLGGGGENPPNQYVGEFRVDAVEGRAARLQPLDQLELDPQAAQTYLNSQGPWIVYETMPADDLDLFAGFTEEQLRALLPERTIEQYLRDNTPSTPDDDPERLVGLDADGKVLPPGQIDEAARTVYRRPLRDYTYLIDDLEKERAQLVARQQALNDDLAKLARAQKGANELQAYRKAERDKWRADLAAVERDLAAIQGLVKKLQQQIENAEGLLAATLQSNARLAEVKADQTGNLTPIGSGALDIDAL